MVSQCALPAGGHTSRAGPLLTVGGRPFGCCQPGDSSSHAVLTVTATFQQPHPLSALEPTVVFKRTVLICSRMINAATAGPCRLQQPLLRCYRPLTTLVRHTYLSGQQQQAGTALHSACMHACCTPSPAHCQLSVLQLQPVIRSNQEIYLLSSTCAPCCLACMVTTAPLQRQHRQVVRCPAGIPDGAAAKPAYPPNIGYGISEEEGDMPWGTPLQKGTLVARLLAAKEASGKTFSQIAEEVGLTNVYCTQLFYNQVRMSSCLAHKRQLQHGHVCVSVGAVPLKNEGLPMEQSHSAKPCCVDDGHAQEHLTCNKHLKYAACTPESIHSDCNPACTQLLSSQYKTAAAG